MGLPKVNGFEVARRIRNERGVIMSTFVCPNPAPPQL
ncbi:MAG: hypothetical protein ACJ8DZ_02250 [Allosphingosinicella sp.]